LKEFQDRVLRIFGPDRDEVTAGWRKLHNEELDHLQSTLTIIKVSNSSRMRQAGHVASFGEMRNT
jgi:hypothetical protein